MPEFNPNQHLNTEENIPDFESTPSFEMENQNDFVETPLQNMETHTYSDEEINNPSIIDVTIADEATPIVVLFGPPACGKTMTMIRLAEYLSDPRRGYTVEPVRAFRPEHDTTYTANCEGFKGMLNNIWAAKKSEGLDFMMLKVFKDGRPIVQILEAPGEHYYDPSDTNEPTSNLLPYVWKIIQSPNRKIWVFMTEPDWKDQGDRKKYSQKIALLRKDINRKDKSVVLFNKVDQTSLNMKAAIKYVEGMYPGLFANFKNEHPISSLWRPYNYIFIPFKTGNYKDVLVGGEKQKRYTAGPDNYPMSLWNAIIKCTGFRL